MSNNQAIPCAKYDIRWLPPLLSGLLMLALLAAPHTQAAARCGDGISR
jgi:hypothetical protein